VTETIALRPDDQIAAALHALREAGVHIAFDDFGTGFASLTTLKRVPVTRLKIDRSFVEDICEAPHSAAIVAAIVSLAERLKLEVVAEGIETEAQRAMLIGLGCTVGQGYLLGRPAEAGNGPAGRLLAA
jgi:EAL domain-containing protein (putative c-di-GMP-specific phosphodiesterase class I)